jgi:hypothetical protein
MAGTVGRGQAPAAIERRHHAQRRWAGRLTEVTRRPRLADTGYSVGSSLPAAVPRRFFTFGAST